MDAITGLLPLDRRYPCRRSPIGFGAIIRVNASSAQPLAERCHIRVENHTERAPLRTYSSLGAITCLDTNSQTLSPTGGIRVVGHLFDSGTMNP